MHFKDKGKTKTANMWYYKIDAMKWKQFVKKSNVLNASSASPSLFNCQNKWEKRDKPHGENIKGKTRGSAWSV